MLHVKSHAVPLQVAVAFAGGAHGVHDAPQVAMLELLAHAPEHTWKFVLHAMPQVVPLHVAEPLAGVPQGVHAAPHVSGSLLLTHTFPQA